MRQARNKIPVEAVQSAIAAIEHPTIEYNIVDLGMIRDITIEGRTIIINMVFPFAEMSIKSKLINTVKDSIKSLGTDPIVRTTTMSRNELKKYFSIEMYNPKGDI